MRVTIIDVAKRAGVSIGTVSRVLNNRDRVHPETRERILKVIAELDYQSNAQARGLAIQQTDTLGLVIPHVNDPFFFQIMRGVEDAASAAGYRLLIASQPYHTSEHRYLELFQRSYVDAMVLVAIDVYSREVQRIIERGVSVVLIQQDIGLHIPTYLVDNYAGALALTEHVLAHGCTRFAYISGSDYTPDSRERLRALRAALAGRGLEIADDYIVQGDFMPGSGAQAALRLLQLPQLPDAIFAANDQMAIDAMKTLSEQGFRVPEDLIVVGFDDIPMAGYVSPGLTTVHQPVYELGWQAAQTALTMLTADELAYSSAPRVLLPPTLVVRQSCGCP